MSEQDSAIIKCNESMTKRECPNCRFCNYMKTYNPDAENPPLHYRCEVIEVLRMCSYCFHVTCHSDKDPGGRAYKANCQQCFICLELRSSSSTFNILEEQYVPAEYVRVCNTCLHVGCDNVDEAKYSNSSSEKVPFLRTTYSSQSTTSLFSSPSSEPHSKKTPEKSSDGTYSELLTFSDTPEQFEQPGSSKGRVEQSRPKLTAGEAASGSQETRITEPNITTDKAAGGSQQFPTVTRQSSTNVVSDEAANDEDVDMEEL